MKLEEIYNNWMNCVYNFSTIEMYEALPLRLGRAFMNNS